MNKILSKIIFPKNKIKKSNKISQEKLICNKKIIRLILINIKNNNPTIKTTNRIIKNMQTIVTSTIMNTFNQNNSNTANN